MIILLSSRAHVIQFKYDKINHTFAGHTAVRIHVKPCLYRAFTSLRHSSSKMKHRKKNKNLIEIA